VDIQDDVAVIRGEARAVLGVSAEADQFPPDIASSHGDDFHGEWECAQDIHLLGFIHDAQEGFRGGRQDFLPGQGATPALDQLQSLVRLIGAINIEARRLHSVKVVNGDAVSLEAFGGGLRAGYGSLELVLFPSPVHQ